MSLMPARNARFPSWYFSHRASILSQRGVGVVWLGGASSGRGESGAGGSVMDKIRGDGETSCLV